MRTSRFVLSLGVAALLGCASLPAAAQRGEAEVQRLIDQLQPGSTTRGIRVPSESAPGAAPSGDRVAAPTAKPAAPQRPAATTAQDGVAAASLTVLFPTGSAALTAEAARSIDPLGRALTSQQLAPYRFRIEGHTDTVGAAQMNQQLSEARAQAVRDYLIQRYGVQPDRLEAIGLGDTQLLVQTPPQTPERRNRRVQIINLGS